MSKGKKLDFTPEKVTWRFDANDIELLRTIHPDVNEVARVLIREYCSRLRAKLQGQLPTPPNDILDDLPCAPLAGSDDPSYTYSGRVR